jgi:hypothetical protein
MAISSASTYTIVAILAAGAVCTYAGHLMAKEIKRNYPILYDDIGRPAPFSWRSGYEQWRFLAFVYFRRYRSLGNKIKILGDVVLLCSFVILILFLYLVLFRLDDFRGFATIPH